MEKEPELVRRARVTQATMARFRERQFDWRTGATCLHMLHFHLRKMGHRPPELPRIRSLLRAKRELDKRGWGGVADMLDTLLPRIPHASMRVGDVAVFASADGLGAITVCAGAHVLGWHEDAAGFAILDPVKIDGAWRC